MNWFDQSILYSIPAEIDSWADSSLHGSVIQCLNTHYNNVNFKDIPNTLTTLITTYTNELFGCINEFETNDRELRHEFKSKTYSCVIVEGVDVFFMKLMIKGTMIVYMNSI